MEGKTKKIAKKIALYVILILLAVIWVVPMFTLVATAIKSQSDFYSGIGLFELPDNIAWDNFINAITQGRLLTYMKNDLIVSCLKVPLGIFVEALAAFALTRLKVKHKTGIFVFFLIGMMLPMQTALVPINVIYSKLHKPRNRKRRKSCSNQCNIQQTGTAEYILRTVLCLYWLWYLFRYSDPEGIL